MNYTCTEKIKVLKLFSDLANICQIADLSPEWGTVPTTHTDQSYCLKPIKSHPQQSAQCYIVARK